MTTFTTKQKFEDRVVPNIIDHVHLKTMINVNNGWACSLAACEGDCPNCIFAVDRKGNTEWDRLERLIETDEWIVRYEI